MEEHLPLDSALSGIYRVGGALAGFVLLTFAISGFFTGPEFFTTDGEAVLGLRTNGLLSLISAVFGLVLLGGAAIGGNVAATTNTVVGTMLLLSGLVNLALLRTDANFLAFRMSNVIFSFVVGVVLLTFGLYGRISSGDPRAGESDSRSRGGGTADSPRS